MAYTQKLVQEFNILLNYVPQSSYRSLVIA